jgi:hypothetical protein
MMMANEIAVGLTGRSSDHEARLDSSSEPPMMIGMRAEGGDP